MRRTTALLCVLSTPIPAFAQTAAPRPPVIDVHLHSVSLGMLKAQGPNPISGAKPLESVNDHLRQTLAAMERYNIVLGLVSGFDLDGVEQFRSSNPERIWAAPQFGKPGLDLARLRELYGSGRLAAMGEITAQYEGLSPSDPGFDPYLALAEELDVPVGIHTGLSFPGITRGAPRFRVSLGNPLLFEELLNRHPKLRVYLAHAGLPFLTETVGILTVYPQVYVDVGVISWIYPREVFYDYLKQLIKFRLGRRILFGTDQMSWPDTIGMAIEAIEAADFLSEQQKRDILYNNAARFLRLTPEQIAKHHGTSPK